MPQLAKALNPLVAVPEKDIQPNMRTALQYARLLNEARILLEHVRCGASLADVGDAIASLEARCHEQVGPIIREGRQG